MLQAVWHSTFHSSFPSLVLVHGLIVGLFLTIFLSRGKQTLQLHDYTNGGEGPVCATAMELWSVERGAAQASAPAVTTHLQSSCWQQLAEGSWWAPCSDTAKAGAAYFRCVFVFMNLLFGIRLSVCEELRYPLTTLSRNQSKNQWPLRSPKC